MCKISMTTISKYHLVILAPIMLLLGETTQPLDLTVGRLDEGGHSLLFNDVTMLEEPHEPLANCSAKNDVVGSDVDEVSADDATDTFVCVCSRSLPDYDTYIDHMSLCAKSKLTPYKACDICGKFFFSSSGYMKHKRLHVGAYKYRCNVCRKGFFDRTHLNAHVDASHSKVRRYECSECDKSFFWKHHLKRHLVTCDKTKDASRKAAQTAQSPVEKTNVGGGGDIPDAFTFEWIAE